MSHDSPEDIQKHVKTYLTVFAALGILTVLTVGVAYLGVPIWAAITIAMAVAITKGTLVAGVFMHLFGEKKIVMYVLLLTAAMFLPLVLLPFWGEFNKVGTWTNPADVAADKDHGAHGDAHGEEAHDGSAESHESEAAPAAQSHAEEPHAEEAPAAEAAPANAPEGAPPAESVPAEAAPAEAAPAEAAPAEPAPASEPEPDKESNP